MITMIYKVSTVVSRALSKAFIMAGTEDSNIAFRMSQCHHRGTELAEHSPLTVVRLIVIPQVIDRDTSRKRDRLSLMIEHTAHVVSL